ncbi:MAG: 3-isopropylmalate dehydratase large subunit [Anaerolineae bacterium]
MGMTITEKILAAHCGRPEVHAGEFITASVDLVFANELSGIVTLRVLREWQGFKRVFDTDKVVFVFDHFTPNKDISTAMIVQELKAELDGYGVKYYESGRNGIEHVLLPELGLIAPGDLVLGGDSHSCTHGAFGAFATGVGSSDIAAAMALGEVWLKVPATLKLVYHGQPQKWVGGKDLILHTLRQISVSGALYQTMEFSGEAIDSLTLFDRLTMANMAIEGGGKAGIFAADEKTLDFLRQRGGRAGTVYHSDPDAEFSDVVEFDVGDLEPQVAFPYLPENSRPVSEAGDVPIDQVVIGFCTNGSLHDLRQAAGVLKGRKIHPKTRAVVIPGSQNVYKQALKEGLIETFIEADCAVSTPTCGPCIGGHMGVLAAGERCLSTSNRNFVGRMGHRDSEIYLANPAVAAATAIAGHIVSPEEVI